MSVADQMSLAKNGDEQRGFCMCAPICMYHNHNIRCVSVHTMFYNFDYLVLRLAFSSSLFLLWQSSEKSSEGTLMFFIFQLCCY